MQYALLLADTPLCSVSGEPVCTLPATYFVVLEEAESGAQKYLVSFQDLEGYVAASAVECVDYEPVTKFPYRTARVNNDGLSVNMRATPTKTGALVTQIPPDATLTLYGPREGDELYAGAGTTWLFVSYASNAARAYGYVYAPLLTVPALSPNNIEKMPEPTTDIDRTPTNPRFTDITKIAFIAALCVPAVIVVLIAFYRPESKRTPRHARRGE